MHNISLKSKLEGLRNIKIFEDFNFFEWVISVRLCNIFDLEFNPRMQYGVKINPGLTFNYL